MELPESVHDVIGDASASLLAEGCMSRSNSNLLPNKACLHALLRSKPVVDSSSPKAFTLPTAYRTHAPYRLQKACRPSGSTNTKQIRVCCSRAASSGVRLE
eukprot:1065396-Pelagomonas_calceolata.AAC.9